MAKTFAVLKSEVLSELQDVSSAIYDLTPNTTEIENKLEAAIREVSDYRPYFMQEVFKIESRTGSSTTTTSNKLVDSAAAFVDPDDVGKSIYNTTDKTWADVTAVDSATTLSLSKDIMVSGEAYEMFNKNCRNSKEIYIGDITDYIGDNHGVIDDAFHPAQYPLGTKRNTDVSGDILTIQLDSDPTASDTGKEVFVWFKKRHRVSQLTDLAGTVNGTPAAGAKTLVVAGFSLVEVIAEDMLFNITGIRGTYRTTQATTLSGGAGTIYFWPGLDKTLTTGVVITVIGSTLNNRLERLVVQIATGKAIMSKALKDTREIPKGGGGQPPLERQLGSDQYGLAIQELRSGRQMSVYQTYSRS